jgi:SAM-dependent methyltransferase
MALYKEWLLPLARALIRHNVHGPVYALGDQASCFSARYAKMKLASAGLLLNPNAPLSACHFQPENISVRSILALLGIDNYHDIDLNGAAEISADLSTPLLPELCGVARSVMDWGTSEHIFNIPQTFANIYRLLKPGGTIVHIAPVSWFEHGFFNFNPLFFKEYYSYNGFDILTHGLILVPFQFFLETLYQKLRHQPFPYKTPSFYINDESVRSKQLMLHLGLTNRTVFLFVARKPMEEREPRMPIQGMYETAIRMAVSMH